MKKTVQEQKQEQTKTLIQELTRQTKVFIEIKSSNKEERHVNSLLTFKDVPNYLRRIADILETKNNALLWELGDLTIAETQIEIE